MREKIYVLETVLKVVAGTLSHQSILDLLSNVDDPGEETSREIADERVEASVSHFLDSVVNGG